MRPRLGSPARPWRPRDTWTGQYEGSFFPECPWYPDDDSEGPVVSDADNPSTVAGRRRAGAHALEVDKWARLARLTAASLRIRAARVIHRPDGWGWLLGRRCDLCRGCDTFGCLVVDHRDVFVFPHEMRWGPTAERLRLEMNWPEIRIW